MSTELEEARALLRSAAKDVEEAKKLLEALPEARGATTVHALAQVIPWLKTTRREAHRASRSN